MSEPKKPRTIHDVKNGSRVLAMWTEDGKFRREMLGTWPFVPIDRFLELHNLGAQFFECDASMFEQKPLAPMPLGLNVPFKIKGGA